MKATIIQTTIRRRHVVEKHTYFYLEWIYFVAVVVVARMRAGVRCSVAHHEIWLVFTYGRLVIGVHCPMGACGQR